MNTKLHIFTSVLIALLCHLFIFSFCTVIFLIDPVKPKPQFFFLGPILKQSDVDHDTPENNTRKNSTLASHPGPVQTEFKNMHNQPLDSEKNPFTIQTIRKPLLPKTPRTQNKVLIKSTFQEDVKEEQTENPREQDPEEELGIQPYRPLRSRIPGPR